MSISALPAAESTRPVAGAFGRTLARIASADAALFALVYVLVPNVPFMLMWLVITPRRMFAVPFYFLAGLVAVRAPLWVGALLFTGVAVLDVLLVISGIFDLSPELVLDAIQYAPMLDLGGSVLYAALAVIMAATVAAIVWLTGRYRARLATASPLLALACMFAWLGVEAVANTSLNKSFGRQISGLVDFDSAMHRSGLATAHPGAENRNLLVVMVEGLGAYTDPRHTRLLTDLIDTPAVRARYDFASGTSPYLGSTTGAAARELCGEWGDYLDYRDGAAKTCLPSTLMRAGYDTFALHGFTEKFFDRDRWYPKIGFGTSMFSEQLEHGPLKETARRCGLTFKGLCDRDVGEVARRLLTEPHDAPRFVYWLTLNTHMPFNLEEATRRFACANEGGVFADKTVCYLTEMWADVVAQTVAIATDPDLPPSDILIVGDHHTPFFTRSARRLFRDGEVAWFALKARPHN